MVRSGITARLLLGQHYYIQHIELHAAMWSGQGLLLGYSWASTTTYSTYNCSHVARSGITARLLLGQHYYVQHIELQPCGQVRDYCSATPGPALLRTAHRTAAMWPGQGLLLGYSWASTATYSTYNCSHVARSWITARLLLGQHYYVQHIELQPCGQVRDYCSATPGPALLRTAHRTAAMWPGQGLLLGYSWASTATYST